MCAFYEKKEEKTWEWYATDMKRLCKLITPTERVIEKLVKKQFSAELAKKYDVESMGMLSQEEMDDCFQRVLKWTSTKLKYDLEWSGKALTPVETLASGSGVCLEFSNLAITLMYSCLFVYDETFKPYRPTHALNPNWYCVYGRTKEKTNGEYLYHAWVGKMTDSNSKFLFFEPQNHKKTHQNIINEYMGILAYNGHVTHSIASNNEVKKCLAALSHPNSWV
eukprot:475782_1